MAKKLINNSGFTLLEVLIATGIFAMFATAFVITMNNNMGSSMRMEEEIKLQELCTNKLNEILLDPPTLKESLTLNPKSKTFEKHSDYEYTLTWKQFILPDYEKLKGNEEGENPEDSSPYEKMIYTQVKDNLKNLIWQLEVTVKNKITGKIYSLSTWIKDHSAKVSFKKI